MTPVETIALIIAVVAAIKILVILIKPKSWMSVIDLVYGKPTLTMIVSLILAVVVFYYLNLAEITIVEIFAVMLFLGLLAAMTVSVYFKEVRPILSKMLVSRKFMRKAWLPIIIWIILIIWVLYILLV